jgi:hypothetical protein
MSFRSRKLLRWSLGIFLGLIVLLVVTVFAAQWLVDVPSVRADLSKKLSDAVNGKITWQDVNIQLLPLPHGVVQGAHLEIPDVVKVDVATTAVTLRLLPLFRGRAELKAVTLLQPSVDVWIAKASDKEQAKNKDKPATTDNPLALYRNAMRPVVDVIARFAPNTTLAIDQGRVALHVRDLPSFEASALNLSVVTDGEGVVVQATARGTYWDELKIEGRLEFADLKATAKLDAAGLKPQTVLEGLLTNVREALVLSSVGARLAANTDGKTDIGIGLDLDLPKAALQRRGKRLDIVAVRLAGAVKFSGQDIEIALDKIHLGELAPNARATLLLTGPNREPSISIGIETLDLARVHDAAMTLAGDQPLVSQYVSRLRGGQLLDLNFNAQGKTFSELFSLPRLHATVSVAGGGMLLPTIERNATELAAQVELIDGTLKIKNAHARLGASQIRQASASIGLLKPLRLSGTQARATLVLDDLLPRMREQPAFAQALQAVPELTGAADLTVRNLALRFDRPAEIIYDLSVRPRRLRVQAKQLPAPLDLNDGNARITPHSITLDRIGAQLFSSNVTLSGEVTDFRTKHPRVVARLSDGIADRNLIDWLWQRAAIADRFKPVTPIRFSAQRAQWSDAGLELVADAKLATGPSVGVDLLMHEKTFVLRRGTFKDGASDAVFTFAKRDPFIEFGFSGVFAGRSLAAVFGRAPEQYAGRINGDLQLQLDVERQRRSTVRGKLSGAQIDLQNIVAMPIMLERVELQGGGDALHIGDLSVDWAAQKATLRGDITRQENGFALALEVDTPGVVIDALRAQPSEPTSESESAPQRAESKTETQPVQDAPFDPWSLPLNGTVALRAGFLEYNHLKAEGVRALVTRAKQTATLNVTEGSLCGMTMPLTFHATPQNFDASVVLSTKNQSLTGFTQCLGAAEVSLTGNFDLDATLATQGQADNLAKSLTQNLTGTVAFRAYAGEIRKMALLGNILSLKSVGDLLEGNVDLKEAGFKYRDISLRAHVGKSTVTVEQAAIDSAALGMATTGTINLDDYQSRLTVLVAPFGRIDRLVRNVPILGYVMGGALTSLPVGVSGDIRNPIVVPLGPGAVGSELVGIFERAFKLPGKLVESTGASIK